MESLEGMGRAVSRTSGIRARRVSQRASTAIITATTSTAFESIISSEYECEPILTLVDEICGSGDLSSQAVVLQVLTQI
jgi:hypothetical protein